jgi:hypothetical protein
LLDLFSVRPALEAPRFLRPLHLGSGDHFHGAGDLEMFCTPLNAPLTYVYPPFCLPRASC